MTRIGMALDPSEKRQIPAKQRRGRTVAQVLIAVVAVVELAGAGWLISNRSVSTVVTVEDLLAEVRSPGSTGDAPTSTSEQTVGAAVTPDVAPTAATDAAQGTDTSTDTATDTTETTAGTSDAPSPGTQTRTDESAPPSESTAGTAATPATAKVFAMPTEGIYAYASEGYESISLGGARHDYPERTFAIVEQQDGCAWTFDHRVVEEKRSVNTYCTEGPVQSARAYDGWITFFGSTAESHYTCDNGTRSDLRDKPGSRHVGECTAEGSKTNDTVTFVGIETLSIGGVAVQAMRYHIDTVISGDVVGTSTQEVWVHPEDALLLRLERDTDSSAYEFGAQVDYVERAVFTLESLTPQR